MMALQRIIIFFRKRPFVFSEVGYFWRQLSKNELILFIHLIPLILLFLLQTFLVSPSIRIPFTIIFNNSSYVSPQKFNYWVSKLPILPNNTPSQKKLLAKFVLTNLTLNQPAFFPPSSISSVHRICQKLNSSTSYHSSEVWYQHIFWLVLQQFYWKTVSHRKTYTASSFRTQNPL